MIIPKMTVEEALAFSDEWIRGVTLHKGSQGWRVVCWILAEELRRRYGIGGELVIARKQRDELLSAAQEFICDWDSCKSSGEWPVRSLGKLRAAMSIVKGDAA